MVANPADAPATNPALLTEATAAFEVDQATGFPVRIVPFASFGAAVSCDVCPTRMMPSCGVPASVTLATGAGGLLGVSLLSQFERATPATTQAANERTRRRRITANGRTNASSSPRRLC